MQRMYVQDLENSVEIVLDARGRVRNPVGGTGGRSRQQGHANRAAAGAIGIGNAVGAAITNRRELGPAESRLLAFAGCVLIAVALACLFSPRLITVPAAVLWPARQVHSSSTLTACGAERGCRCTRRSGGAALLAACLRCRARSDQHW